MVNIPRISSKNRTRTLKSFAAIFFFFLLLSTVYLTTNSLQQSKILFNRAAVTAIPILKSYDFGILTNSTSANVDLTHISDEYSKGVRFKTLELAWEAYEPNNGSYNVAYIQAKKNELTTYASQGFKIVLDLGIHYTPAWVRNLDTNALFKNQYGDVYTSSSLDFLGKNIANSVFNNSVRSSLSSYIRRVFTDFRSESFYGVRLGGLWYGELHYPEHNFPSDRVNSFWGYDDNAQGISHNLPEGIPPNPVPGWIPNPVNNGTFEKGDDGNWILTAGYDAFVTTNVHQGVYALQKVNPGAWANITRRTVQVVPGRTYNFSGWLKSSNPSVSACVLIIKTSDYSQLAIGCTSNSNYTQVTGSFTPTEKTITIFLDANNSAPAVLAYDDISIMAKPYTYDENHQNALDFYLWYEGCLINYQNWLIQQYRQAGFNNKIFLTHPGYGLRPEAGVPEGSANQIQEAVNYDLSLTSNASINGEIQMAQNWYRQISSLPSDQNLIIYMEWVERNLTGIDNDESLDKGVWSPVKYIGYLAAKFNRPAYGENSGSNNYTDLLTAFTNMVNNNYEGMFWFDEQQLYSNNYATITQYGNLIAQFSPSLTPTPSLVPSRSKNVPLVSVTGQAGFGTNADLNLLAKKTRLLKSIGVDALRVDIPWSEVENNPGEWGFSLWRERLKVIVDSGLLLKPIITVHFPDYIPAWFWERYPDAKFKNDHGVESRQYISYWHSQVRPTVEQVTKAYFEQLFPEFQDKILAFHISAGMYGEPWYPHLPELGFYAFDPYAQADFRQKMQIKYQRSITQANNAWQTNFLSWQEVVLPQPGEYLGKRKFWEDFLTWYRTSKEEYLIWLVAMTRKYTSKPLIVYGGAGIITDQIWAEAIDSLTDGTFSQNSHAWAIQRMLDNRAVYPFLAQNNIWIEPPNLPHEDLLQGHVATTQGSGLSFIVWGENEGSPIASDPKNDPMQTAEIVKKYNLNGMEFLSTENNPLFNSSGDPLPLFFRLKESILFLKGDICLTSPKEGVGVGTYFSGYARWAHSVPGSDDNVITNNIALQSAAFHSVGAKWAREDIPWHVIEKTQGNFDWSLTGAATDLALSQYNADDNIIAILERTPAWASSGPDGDIRYPDKDSNLVNWKNYVDSVVGRYKNKIKYWEIWNEADISQDPGITFIPKPGETREQSYYKLLKAAYTVIKRVDPHARVLINSFGSWNINGDLNNPRIGDSMVDFIMSQPHEDGWPYFDIFNIHIYSYGDPATEIQRARNLLKNWSQTINIPIWVTETNPNNYLQSVPPAGLPTPGSGGNTVDNAAAIMPWWLCRELNAGADNVFWFALLNWQCDPGVSGCTNFSTAGLNKVSDFTNQSTWYVMKNLLATPYCQVCPTGKPAKNLGNANCDEKVDLSDFEFWRQEFLGIRTSKTADFDCNNEVNLSDFEYWRRGSLNNP